MTLDDIGPDEEPALARLAERTLTDVDAYLAARQQPRLILGRCRHVFTGTAGRYLCDPCEAAEARPPAAT